MSEVEGRLRRLLRSTAVQDTLLAVVLAGLALAALWNPQPMSRFDYRDPDLLGVVLAGGSAAAVAFRSRFPVPTLLVTASMTLVYAALGYSQGAGFFAALFPLYSLAVARSLRVSATGAALTAVGVAAVLVAGPYDPTLSDWASNLFVIAIAWMLGRLVRVRRARTAELLDRNHAMAEARAAETRALLMAERARTAREMQDLVAHNLTEIGVQVAAARRLVRRAPDRAETLLLEAERVGRSALGELRRVGGVLADDGPAEREPQPDLEAVRRLVDSMRSSGARVRLATSGDHADVPAGVALTAYRVVEELLSQLVSPREGEAEVDLVRGAGGFRVEVTCRPDRSTVRWDQGRGPEAVAARLRDRVAVYGGELVTGERRDGSLRVSARFPVPDEAGEAPHGVVPEATPVGGRTASSLEAGNDEGGT